MIYRISPIPNKIKNDILHITRKNNLNIYMEIQKILQVKAILNKNKNDVGITILDCILYYRAIITKIAC
jgi:hypothetical protein